MSSQPKEFPELVVSKSDTTPEGKPEPGLIRKIGAYNDKLLLAEHRMAKGWKGSVHSHSHEQVAYMVSGHLKLYCLGKTFDLRAGDSFVVRGGVEHGASAEEDTVLIDVFTPCREEFIPRP